MKKRIKGWITPTSLTIAATAVAIILGFVFGGVLASDTTPQTPRVEVAEVTPQLPTLPELFRLTNEERTKTGAKPLELSPLLNKSAQMKADELAMEGWDDTPHISDAGKRGYEYIIEQKIPNCLGSENLTQNIYVNNSESAVRAWMDSEEHRAALLDGDAWGVGYGISKSFVVMHLCKTNPSTLGVKTSTSTTPSGDCSKVGYSGLSLYSAVTKDLFSSITRDYNRYKAGYITKTDLNATVDRVNAQYAEQYRIYNDYMTANSCQPTIKPHLTIDHY